MYAEVWQSKAARGQAFHWHLKSRNGRIVTDAEAFPTRAHALRAVKACVRAIVKPVREEGYYGHVIFALAVRDGRTMVTWS